MKRRATKLEKHLMVERDAVDWAIRQLQTERQISMPQMVLLFRTWSKVIEKGRRLTTAEIRRVIRAYRKYHAVCRKCDAPMDSYGCTSVDCIDKNGVE